MLRDAHQDVPPELERYAYSAPSGSGFSRYGRGYGGYGRGGGHGMTGSNNIPIGGNWRVCWNKEERSDT